MPGGIPVRLRLGEAAARFAPRSSAATGSSTRALRDGVQVVLWFEHDLYDQLQLIDALAFVDEAGGSPELIVVSSFPGKPSFRGLGELSPDELETLWPAGIRRRPTARRRPRRLGSVSRAGSRGARGSGGRRRAARAAPRRVAASARGAACGGDGLSGTERRALEAIAAGASTPGVAFVAAQELEEAPFLGDAWFFRTLAELGGGTAGSWRPTTAAAAGAAAPRRRHPLRLDLPPADRRGRTRARAARPTASSCSGSTAGSAAPT